jgi:hypothetical protein
MNINADDLMTYEDIILELYKKNLLEIYKRRENYDEPVPHIEYDIDDVYICGGKLYIKLKSKGAE